MRHLLMSKLFLLAKFMLLCYSRLPIKAMLMRFGGEIARPKIFPVKSETRSDAIISRSNDIMTVKWRPSWIFEFPKNFRKAPKLNEK